MILGSVGFPFLYNFSEIALRLSKKMLKELKEGPGKKQKKKDEKDPLDSKNT